VKITITGGAGFIGSHLTERLLNEGHEVCILDNLSTGNLHNLSAVNSSTNLKIVNGSILDSDLCSSLVKQSDYVFHFAAAVGVFKIVNNPLESLRINLLGTENLVDVATKYKIPLFLASSSEVYGKNSKDSLSETDDRIIGSPSKLRWTYSEAKALDESIVYANFLLHGLQGRIVRFFNTVGPRQIGNYGMVIPRLVNQALAGEPINVFGDGTQRRCFLHVYDAIDAIMSVAFAHNTVGKTINIGNKHEISITELSKLIIKVTNSKSPVKYVPYQEAYGSDFEDMERRVPNIDLINELVGWKPKISLEQIIIDVAKEIKLNKENGPQYL